MMFLPYIMPSYNEAVALSGILSATTALVIVVRNLRQILWRKMVVVVFFNVFVSFFVINCMNAFSSDALRRCLGAVLVLVSLYFLFFDIGAKGLFRSFFSKAAVGALSGVMGAMFAMPGPPVVLYGVNTIGNKVAYMATMQAFWLVFNTVYILFRAGKGCYSASTPLLWVVGCAGVFLGVALGKMCFDRISATAFRRGAYLVMLVSGVVAILK